MQARLQQSVKDSNAAFASRATKNREASSFGFTPRANANSRGVLDADWRDRFSGSESAKSSLSTLETPEQKWSRLAPLQYPPPVTPNSARSFAVKGGNVASAYRLLNRTLNENNVRRELRTQERFERPSDKRCRLDSERHRRRFKVAVGKAVGQAIRIVK
ncbi:hypothetical protein MNV49_005026 [Pseudohyphozyma bogoriensis]|nr:hypothetical protein MNV49_005026 [Pseudohyphozyma bogoriensis]